MLLEDLEKLSWQNLPCNWPSFKWAMKKISKTWYFQLHIDIDEYISLLITFQLSSKPLSCCYFRLTNLWHVAAYCSCPGIIQTLLEFVGQTCWVEKHWNVQIYQLIFFLKINLKHLLDKPALLEATWTTYPDQIDMCSNPWLYFKDNRYGWSLFLNRVVKLHFIRVFHQGKLFVMHLFS